MLRTVNTTPTGGGTLVTETQAYNDRNQLIRTDTFDIELSEEITETTYTYDANGNRISKSWYGPGAGGIITYGYDVANRLVSSNTGFHAYYDARTRRIGKNEGGTLTQFRYDGGTTSRSSSKSPRGKSPPSQSAPVGLAAVAKLSGNQVTIRLRSLGS